MHIQHILQARARFLSAAVVVAGLLGGCATNPVTGDRQFNLVSEAQEISMGAEGAKSVVDSIGLVDDPALQQYVSRLGLQLATASERPELPWAFSVVDDPTPNAFAFPGGYIFITRGLLALMGNEAELVSVLGHEIGHVTARHSAAMISRAQVAQIGLGVGSILSPTIAQFSELAAGGLSLLFLSYSRDAERQADDLGFQYALQHGYDVREMVNVFASLQNAGELAGQSAIPHWMASHPNPEDRIRRIEGQISRLDQPLGNARVGVDEFMNHVDGLMFGTNPRHGYFEDTRYLHPDMAFEITFPSGWRTQNLPQAVMAGSPQEDAIVQLTLSRGSPEEAASQFFGQQGLTAGRVQAQTINGLRGVVGPFQAQSQGGAVSGLAAFIRHGEQTFQLVTFARAQQFNAYQQAFRATIGSFAPLTDREALARQPERISIVRTTQPMTLAEFNRRFPSVIEMDKLALINQLPGPEASIPARTAVKRVVRAE
jgi:predicted Zn-dependent protease